MLHPLEFAALLAAARAASGNDHAMIALLGMIGLRVSEACHADIDDIRYQSGYEILHVVGKAPSPPTSRYPSPCFERSGKPRTAASMALSCSTGSANGSTQPG